MGTELGTPPSILLLVGAPARLLGPVLEQAGFSVLVATGLEETLLRSRARPDLVLVSLSSLEESSIFQRLKAEPALVDAPLLALVAPDLAFDEARAARSGAAGVVSTQASERELLALVKAHLALGGLRRDVRAGNRALEERIAARTRDLIAANAALEAEVAERTRVEAALRESEQRYRRLVDLAYEGIWALDKDHLTSFVNDRMAEMLGVTKQEMIGKPEAGFLFEEDLPDLYKRISARRAGHAEQYERRFRHKDGHAIWTIASSTLSFDEAGQFAGSFAMFADITERKRFEVALQEEHRLFMGGKTMVFRWRNEPGWPIEYASRNVEAQLGYSPESLVGSATDYASLVHPDDLETLETEMAKFLGGNAERFEHRYRLRRSDGEHRWVEESTVAEKDCSGTTTHLHGYVQDITEQKLAETALRDSERELKAVVYGSPVPQFVINREHHVVYWNKAMERLSGIREDEVRGTDLHWRPFFDTKHPTMADLLVEEAEEELPRHYLNAVPSVVPGSFQVRRYFTKLGKAGRWVRFSAVAIRDSQGKVIGAAETLEDMSEQVVAEQEREALLAAERAAFREAERVGRVKDEFLATLSHELRTPLNAILGWTQILRKGQPLQGQADLTLQRIERNARSLAGIMDDLLDMSRIISGQSRLEIEVMDLVTVVEEAIATVRPAAEAKGLRLESHLDPAARKFYGDAGRLRQVVWNLLSNATKFTPPGGQINVNLRHLGSNVEIEVRDSGVGIRPEFLPLVFDRFRQADSTITRRYGGLGLGLAIVRHLVEAHGGTVRAASAGENQGATFLVTLPVVPLHAETLAREPARPPERLEPKHAAADLAGLRVLVVDDEPDARELVCWVLEEQHAQVDAAGSAAEAWALLSKRAPDVVVSDIAMPVEDGYSLIRRVRALPADRGGKVPALALTALVRKEDKARSLRAGFQDHIAKPIEPQALVEEVAALAGRGQVQPAEPSGEPNR